MTEKYRKRGNERTSEREEKGGKIGGEIITKGSCKGEDRQIMRKEKNEEWEEGLKHMIKTHS